MDNLDPPFFGPEQPVYPQIDQVVRISGPADANQVYPGFTSQFMGNVLALRDREPCFIIEPNGIALISGYVNARLIGVYGGDANGNGAKPLYAATCCPITGIATGCCPGVSVPSILHMQFSETGCPLQGASCTLTNIIGQTWEGIDNSSCHLRWKFFCIGGIWGLSAFNGPFACPDLGVADIVNCGPPFFFQRQYSGFGCCTGCSSVKVTITP